MAAAKRLAADGPVFVTDRGEPRFALLAIEEYRALPGSRQNLADLLAIPGDQDVELELPPRSRVPNRHVLDFSAGEHKSGKRDGTPRRRA